MLRIVWGAVAIGLIIASCTVISPIADKHWQRGQLEQHIQFSNTGVSVEPPGMMIRHHPNMIDHLEVRDGKVFLKEPTSDADQAWRDAWQEVQWRININEKFADK